LHNRASALSSQISARTASCPPIAR
jgi:hypothetical protein